MQSFRTTAPRLRLTRGKVLDLGFSVSLFVATSKGLGLHEKDVNPADQPVLNRAEYTFTVLYVSNATRSDYRIPHWRILNERSFLLEPGINGDENINPRLLPHPD